MIGRMLFLMLVLLSAVVLPPSFGLGDPSEERIVPGDRVITTEDNTPLKDGERTLLTLKSGAELVATKVNGNWVAVSVQQGGRKVSGWINVRHLARVTDAVRVGDSIVTADDVPLFDAAGHRLLLVEMGTVLKVRDVKEGIVNVVVRQDDKEVAGWIGTKYVATLPRHVNRDARQPKVVPPEIGAPKLDTTAAAEKIRAWEKAQKAQACIERGRTWCLKGEYDKAIAEYDKTIEIEPGRADAYNDRGLAWYEKRQYDKAIADQTKAAELRPDWTCPYNDRGIAWAAKGEYDKAIADYEKAIEIDPQYAIAYNNRGWALYNKGEYDKAITDYGKAIEIDPQYVLAYNNRGIAWAAKGEYDKAITDYDKAIEIDPNYVHAYSNRGTAWAAKGEYDKAITDYDKAIEIDPNYVHAYNNRGWALYNKGEYDKAITDYGKAIEIDPDYVHAYNNRGWALYNKGEYDKAITDYDKAIEIDPNYVLPYNNRGLAWATKGEYDNAIANYDKAIKIDPTCAGAYHGRAWAWIKKGDHDKAIAGCNELIAVAPEEAESYLVRADIWHEIEQDDKAVTDADRALALDPKSPDAYVSRANAWHGKGEHDRAIADYDKAIELAPNAAQVYANRANAWNGKGEYDRAITDAHSALALHPKLASAYDVRGNAWNGKGEYDRAISDYGKEVALDPKSVRAYGGRAAAWAQKGEYDRAIADCTQAIQLEPRYVVGYTNRAGAFNAKGEYDKAIADCSKALELNPKLATAYNNRGNAWAAKGDWDKAIADYNGAVRLAPTLALAYGNRGNAWRATGALDKAVSDYDRALRLTPGFVKAPRLPSLPTTRPGQGPTPRPAIPYRVDLDANINVLLRAGETSRWARVPSYVAPSQVARWYDGQANRHQKQVAIGNAIEAALGDVGLQRLWENINSTPVASLLEQESERAAAADEATPDSPTTSDPPPWWRFEALDVKRFESEGLLTVPVDSLSEGELRFAKKVAQRHYDQIRQLGGYEEGEARAIAAYCAVAEVRTRRDPFQAWYEGHLRSNTKWVLEAGDNKPLAFARKAVGTVQYVAAGMFVAPFFKPVEQTLGPMSGGSERGMGALKLAWEIGGGAVLQSAKRGGFRLGMRLNLSENLVLAERVAPGLRYGARGLGLYQRTKLVRRGLQEVRRQMGPRGPGATAEEIWNLGQLLLTPNDRLLVGFPGKYDETLLCEVLGATPKDLRVVWESDNWQEKRVGDTRWLTVGRKGSDEAFLLYDATGEPPEETIRNVKETVGEIKKRTGDEDEEISVVLVGDPEDPEYQALKAAMEADDRIKVVAEVDTRGKSKDQVNEEASRAREETDADVVVRKERREYGPPLLPPTSSPGRAAAAGNSLDDDHNRDDDPPPPYRTPTLDRLAIHGMRFTNAYAVNPLCSPVRATILLADQYR